MKRIVLLLMIAAAALAPAASASEPIFIPSSPQPDFVNPLSCAFPVLVHTVVDESTVKIFSDGSVIVTGMSRERFTNLVNGKSFDSSPSGPAFFTPNPDGTTTVRLEGVHNPPLPPGFFAPGTPGILWNTAGTIVAQLDSEGNLLAVTTFRVTVLHDICAELA